jgi:amino acid transporter
VATREVESKGLKADALGFVSSVVIGVASTAPGYSLAAVLALVVAAVGVQAPAVLILAFLPMLFIAASYYYMNRADPDCGTTFSWVTRAMGPWAGWIGGWAIIVADVIVMANLAQIAGLYGFLLFDWLPARDRQERQGVPARWRGTDAGRPDPHLRPRPVLQGPLRPRQLGVG